MPAALAFPLSCHYFVPRVAERRPFAFSSPVREAVEVRYPSTASSGAAPAQPISYSTSSVAVSSVTTTPRRGRDARTALPPSPRGAASRGSAYGAAGGRLTGPDATKDLGDWVVRDNGTGIPPEVKEKLFNPFFTTKPAGEGTGLGLSISHDIIVKQHGGSIEVDTRPGEFTEFRIVLPRAGNGFGTRKRSTPRRVLLPESGSTEIAARMGECVAPSCAQAIVVHSTVAVTASGRITMYLLILALISRRTTQVSTGSGQGSTFHGSVDAALLSMPTNTVKSSRMAATSSSNRFASSASLVAVRLLIERGLKK